MASQVEPVPDDVAAVMPMLVCRDVAAVLDFCQATFGSTERLIASRIESVDDPEGRLDEIRERSRREIEGTAG